jgi:hypothetical protein
MEILNEVRAKANARFQPPEAVLMDGPSPGSVDGDGPSFIPSRLTSALYSGQ